MLYRKFGDIGKEVSILGFGAMRLPKESVDPIKVDIKATEKLFMYAIDNGINYFDTAYTYYKGESERAIGRILNGKIREKIMIADKIPISKVEKYEDLENCLDEMLERLGSEYIDVLLLHGLNSKKWEIFQKADVFKFFEKMKAKGKIKYAGFSFHDNVSVFKEIIDAYS